MKNIQQLKIFLDKKVDEYNTVEFIEDDPISVPHRFTKKQDIEIAAFFASIFAWGQRTTIINKSNELMNMLDSAPHDFVLNFSEKDLKRLQHFKHRTFNFTDLQYFLLFLQQHYKKNDSLENAFVPSAPSLRAKRSVAKQSLNNIDFDVKDALTFFHQYFFSLHHLQSRTQKHIATPDKNSTCKRLNMFLRWMVRHDNNGVDFGLWKKIKPSQLYSPLDLHVDRVARKLDLIQRKQNDWQTVIELTENLKKLDADDPVKYDFALFGLGVIENFQQKIID
jgi:uncharacterized protein (TIGR02757 family)